MILGYTYTSKFSKASVFHSLSLLIFKLKPYFVICALAETFAGVNVACKYLTSVRCRNVSLLCPFPAKFYHFYDRFRRGGSF